MNELVKGFKKHRKTVERACKEYNRSFDGRLRIAWGGANQEESDDQVAEAIGVPLQYGLLLQEFDDQSPSQEFTLWMADAIGDWRPPVLSIRRALAKPLLLPPDDAKPTFDALKSLVDNVQLFVLGGGPKESDPCLRVDSMQTHLPLAGVTAATLRWAIIQLVQSAILLGEDAS